MPGAAPPGGAGLVSSVSWTPANLSSSVLKLWLKADTFIGSDGDAVGTWSDSSGNGNDVTGTTTQRPTYKTGILGGKPIMRFDGTANNLQASSSIVNQAAATTLFAVVKQTTTLTAEILSTISSTNGFRWEYQSSSGRNCRWFSSGSYAAASGVADATWAIFTSIVRSTSGAAGTVTHRVNRSDLGTSGSISRTATHNSNLTVGALGSRASSFWNGDIAEILVYEGDLTGSPILVNIENYLKNKYSL